MSQHHSSHPYSQTDIVHAHRIMGNTQDPNPTITTESHGDGQSSTLKTHKVYESEQIKVLRHEYENQDVLDFITLLPNNYIDVYIAYRREGGGHLLPDKQQVLLIDIDDGEILLVNPASAQQVMRFTTSDEDDHISIHDNLVNPVEIHSGAGDDRIIAGSGRYEIYAGPGDDDITLRGGSGYSHVEGGEGNDEINAAGFAHGSFYGGPGDDTIQGSDRTAVILGGVGNDALIGGSGNNIICAGPGDDRIQAGEGNNVIYTSEGFNQVENLKPTDTTYYNFKSELTVDCTKISPEQMDTFPPGQIASNAIHLEPRPLNPSAFIIQGSPFFVGRATDDLYLLNASPTGQRLLSLLEQAFSTSGKPITINELKLSVNGEFIPEDKAGAEKAYIENGQAGTPSYGGHIWYSAHNMKSGTPSVIVLFHELCHAYNLVTGTRLRGTSLDADIGPYMPRAPIKNTELQAVGLPTEASPFDFDGDPNTPPTTTNPEAFSENALRKELGWNLRMQYSLG